MKNALALAVLLLLSSTASAMGEVQCGSAEVAVALAPASKGERRFEAIVTVSHDEKATMLRYDRNIDFIGVECRKNHRGQDFIVFQAYCGGSGCKDLDNFGIIDPIDLRVLLVPNDWNRADAARIFGEPVSAIDNVISLENGKLLRDVHQR